MISHRKSQSVGVETTFQEDIRNGEAVVEYLLQLFAEALIKVTEKQLSAHTLTIKIKYHDFVQITRSRTLAQSISTATDIKELLAVLLKNTDVDNRDVRLLGVTLSSFDDNPTSLTAEQTDLFETNEGT